MNEKKLELYIHIPFCVKKCDYCDFLSFPADSNTQIRYVHALLQEIRYYGNLLGDYHVPTIYIGGGTPSWLEENLIYTVLQQVASSFHVEADAEISIECNPGTVTAKKLDETQWQALTETYPDVKIADRLQEEAEGFKEKKTAAEEKHKTAQNAITGREKPNMEQLNAAFEAAKAAWEKASAALEAAKHLHLDNARVLNDLREGREPLANACKEANTAQHLSDVMAGTESGNRMNLETFVQRSYMEKILRDANRRFRDMANGQFELKLINVEDAGEGKNKGLDLEVYSIVTGKTRSVNTLSGGESFMAALSLALGMADQIQAATAAIHLDVMFIDEGFGSLSDNARNEAVNILKEMAGKQRQIGSISHVSELKDEIENQLIVKKDDRGSHISWR